MSETIVVIGKRATGKTTLIKHMIHELDSIKRVIVVTTVTDDIRTQHAKTEWTGFDKLSNKYVHVYDDYDPCIIDSVMKSSDSHECAIVLDNCLYPCALKRNKSLKKLVTQSKVKVFIAIQYPMLPKWLISATSGFCIFQDNNTSNRKRMYDMAGHLVCNTLDEFCIRMDTVCKEYQCMYVCGDDEPCPLLNNSPLCSCVVRTSF